MAFTRKMLKAMGIEDEKIDEIIEAHTEVTDALKAEREAYKADAEKLGSVQAQLDAAKAKGDDGWKEKHDAVKKELDGLKAEILTSKKSRAVKDLLREGKIAEKRIDAVARLYDLDTVELDDSGAVKDKDRHMEYIGKEFGDYAETVTLEGAHTGAPPVHDPQKLYTKAEIKGMSPDEINKNWDAIKASLGKGE